MATVTIDATTPSTTVNYALLKSCCERLLELARRNSIQLSAGEYNLLWELVTASTTGQTVVGTPTQAVITYT